MKNFKRLSLLLIGCLIGMAFVACKDKDKDEPSHIPTQKELIASLWEGTNPNSGYFVSISVLNSEKCLIRTSHDNINYAEECNYYYNEKNGEFIAKFESFYYEGFIKGKTMTLTVAEYGTFNLTRVK